MPYQKLFLFLCFLASLACGGCTQRESAARDSVADDTAPPVIRVAYFHRNIRCPSCEKIEELARKAVEGGFAESLASGNVKWSTFNIDEPENRHFEEDYKLQAQSVVLSEMRGGKETRWKNLEKVWDLLTDDAAFIQYIQDEIRVFGQPTGK